MSIGKSECWYSNNRRVGIRHLCKKTVVWSFHQYLINTGVEKNKQQLNIYYNFNHQMSLSKSKIWYSNNFLHFSKRAVPLDLIKHVKMLAWIQPNA
jgi:hypothetical protein